MSDKYSITNETGEAAHALLLSIRPEHLGQPPSEGRDTYPRSEVR